jgi:hypothetical protein
MMRTRGRLVVVVGMAAQCRSGRFTAETRRKKRKRRRARSKEGREMTTPAGRRCHGEWVRSLTVAALRRRRKKKKKKTKKPGASAWASE